METGHYIKKRLEESQVISLLIDTAKVHYGNLDFFYDVTNIPREPNLNFDSYFITQEVLRTELDLSANQKPGDIDILIIPARRDRIFYEYTSAYEVKVVRPTNKNIKRNANSLGTTQIHGLINDGFPLIGLIQVCMNEPVHPKYLQHVPNLDNVNEIFTFDPFPLYSIETQYKRVLKTDLPKYVGINIFGLSFDQNEDIIIQNSAKFTHFKQGFFNPHSNNILIEKIKIHFEQNRFQYVKKTNGK